MKKITIRQYATGLYNQLQEQPQAAVQTVENFIKLITQNRDRHKIPEIQRILENIYAEAGHSFAVTLTTISKMDSNKQAKLEKNLAQKLQADVTLHTKTDKSIIGGAIVRINNTKYDGSLKAQIHNLYKQFTS